MAICPATANDVTELLGFGGAITSSPPLPVASGPFTVSDGGGLAFAQIDAGPATKFRARFQFTNPVTDSDGFYPPGYDGLNNLYVYAVGPSPTFDILNPVNMTLTVHSQPVGAALEIQSYEFIPSGYCALLLTPNEPCLPGDYDVTIEIEFVETAGAIGAVTMGTGEENTITVSEWSFTCTPEEPEPEPEPDPASDCVSTLAGFAGDAEAAILDPGGGTTGPISATSIPEEIGGILITPLSDTAMKSSFTMRISMIDPVAIDADVILPGTWSIVPYQAFRIVDAGLLPVTLTGATLDVINGTGDFQSYISGNVVYLLTETSPLTAGLYEFRITVTFDERVDARALVAVASPDDPLTFQSWGFDCVEIIDPYELDSGELGCGEYDVWIYKRGGVVPFSRVLFNSIEYHRRIDEVSTATITLGIEGMKPYVPIPIEEDFEVGNNPGDFDNCCWLLSQINPWEHELVIFRNGNLVWAGPIQTMEISNATGEATIEADDIMKWFDRRFIRCEIDMFNADLSMIWASIFHSAHDVAPVGIELAVTKTGIKGDRYYAPEQYHIAGDELRELARTGLDWTCVGRTVMVGPQEIATPAVATLVDANFQKAPTIIKSGIDIATRWVVGGGGGGADGPTYWSEVPAVLQDDPSFGLIEKFVNEPSILDADDPESSSRAAAQTRWDLLHSPVVFVREGLLAPSAGVTIEELVPGARIDMSLIEVCQPIVEEYRLRDVDVTYRVNEEGGGMEEVKITVTPLGTEKFTTESTV